jgi:hypothetical protein
LTINKNKGVGDRSIVLNGWVEILLAAKGAALRRQFSDYLSQMNRCAGTGSSTGEKRASRCLLVGAHPHKPTVAHREDHLSWCCELVEWKEILEWFCLTRVAVQDKVAASHQIHLEKDRENRELIESVLTNRVRSRDAHISA